jgi:CubicO group peptidase (beta-lactamase class C family)
LEKKPSGEILPVFQQALGKAQYSNIRDVLGTSKPSSVQLIARQYLQNYTQPDVASLNGDKRHLYRTASNTKNFIAVTALFLEERYGLDLDTPISPTYVDFQTLGMEHFWDAPYIEYGYEQAFPSSLTFVSSITFQHLLTHTSGSSREAKIGDLYGYAASRTFLAPCPPKDIYLGKLKCDQSEDNNWRQWAEHIVS